MSTKFIFITGGVASGLGKGIACSSLGALLQARNFTVCLRKLDPYLNVDPGTMSPYIHGEVFVTEDGMETDLDLGNYERFTNKASYKSDYVTTGQIYSKVLERERKGEYLGGDVQVIPHITDTIKDFITHDSDKYDFVLLEIGGTVGDIEGLPYLEAIRQLRYQLGVDRTIFLHVTLIPYIATSKELKTKPTQHSVRSLLSVGIQPDILLCRSEHPVTKESRKKISLLCNVLEERVIAAMDVSNIYQVPWVYHQEGLDHQVCSYFGIRALPEKNLIKTWQDTYSYFCSEHNKVKIAIVGKYIKLHDAYKSLNQALIHAGYLNHTDVEIVWVDSESEDSLKKLETVDGIIVPGGFGQRGVDGKLFAINYAKNNKKPFLGICFGMQLACISALREIPGFEDASSTEFGETKIPIVGLMKEWIKDGKVQLREEDSNKGGTMRLGLYPCKIEENSLAFLVYEKTLIHERHRHRYEVNPFYENKLNESGLFITGRSPDGNLPEIVERKDHPFFIGVQFHPEFCSKLFDPHPLFAKLVKACINNK